MPFTAIHGTAPLAQNTTMIEAVFILKIRGNCLLTILKVTVLRLTSPHTHPFQGYETNRKLQQPGCALCTCSESLPVNYSSLAPPPLSAHF